MMLRAIQGPLPLRGRILRTVCIVLGLMLGFTFVTIDMTAEQQAVLTLAGIVTFLVINRSPSRKATLVCVSAAGLITMKPVPSAFAAWMRSISAPS